MDCSFDYSRIFSVIISNVSRNSARINEISIVFFNFKALLINNKWKIFGWSDNDLLQYHKKLADHVIVF